MIEAQQEVLRRVLGDALHGRVRICPEDCVQPQPADGAAMLMDRTARIDWNAYLKVYIQELADAEEKAILESNREQKGHIASVDDESPIIFGGDTP